MKKIIILLFVLAFNLMNVEASDYSSYCSQKSAHKTISGTISSLTGVNALKRNIIESEIQSALKKKTGGKFEVKAANFYGNSATSGAFKSLKLTGTDINYDGLYVSNLTANTLCGYNEVKYENKSLSFVENSVIEFSAELTEADINKSLIQSDYGKAIERLNSDSSISSVMKIVNHNLKINGDKLVFNYEISLLPRNKDIFMHLPIKLSNINLAFSSGLAVQDGKIQLMNFGLNDNQINYGFLLPLINKFNPTTWGVSGQKDFIGDAQVKIENVKIQNSKIELKGVVLANASK